MTEKYFVVIENHDGDFVEVPLADSMTSVTLHHALVAAFRAANTTGWKIFLIIDQY